MIQSRDALCYHMTCRGHRWNEGVGIENADYKETMDKGRREFLRKWGEWIQNDSYQYPIINPKYNKGLVIENCNDQFIEMLEPWFDTLYVDCDYEPYIQKEQKRTVTDLLDRLKPYDNEKQNDIIVKIDTQKFTQQDYVYINQLSAIIQDSGKIGEFELGNLKISIMRIEEYLVS